MDQTFIKDVPTVGTPNSPTAVGELAAYFFNRISPTAVGEFKQHAYDKTVNQTAGI